MTKPVNPPDLEELLRRSQEKVKKVFPGDSESSSGAPIPKTSSIKKFFEGKDIADIAILLAAVAFLIVAICLLAVTIRLLLS